jgi:cytochrome d ubiquinol oxidase subunit II
MHLDPTLICAGLIVFGIIMYVILDGFDLGVGILFPLAPSDKCRNVMMSSIAPVWDGNGTWLIYGGGVLFAAFPTAYSIVLPAFYVPIMIMLFALMFRGVAFEFRMKARKSRWIWDYSFNLGSLITAFAQGVILGALIDGVKVVDNKFAGGTFDFLTAFSLTTGLAVVFGYGLLGATWLVIKTEGQTLRWAREIARPLLFAVLFFIFVVSIRTPSEYPEIAARWFSTPNIFILAPIPLTTIFLAGYMLKALHYKNDKIPFKAAVGIFLLCFLGLAVSLFPHIILPNVTIWQASAPLQTQKFVLTVVAVSLPIVLGYTYFVYTLFRGKVDPNKTYY